jgi:hypothetical protein
VYTLTISAVQYSGNAPNTNECRVLSANPDAPRAAGQLLEVVRVAGMNSPLGVAGLPAISIAGAAVALPAGAPALPSWSPTKAYTPTLWYKRTIFDSNDADACAATCPYTPAFCTAENLASVLPNGLEGVKALAEVAADPSAVVGSGSGSGSCEAEVPLDLRLLPKGFAGTDFASDAVVASSRSCDLLKSKGSAMQCSEDEADVVELDGLTFVYVDSAANLQISPASTCGA